MRPFFLNPNKVTVNFDRKDFDLTEQGVNLNQ